ncbi:outer membrane beta-barrel protein [Vibrio sp. 99-70-13A1]|uniref:outer membrane protein n=1 Tax=Vibrio sp. 99-70-13A1 TaxID=2607601 RepID=UPI0014938B55|nr:outer membrane beta-barrel protein [Vibrio sp. 99-70-13A1]NOH95597.1 porin family protein [Vibrio sp. 99-70-13A1]
MCYYRAALLASAHLHAASSQNDIYTDLCVSSNKSSDSSTLALHYKVGYNYYFTPFIALDLSYTDSSTLSDPSKAPNSSEFSTSYKGVGAGVKLQHYLNKRFSIYVKGGASHLTITERSWDQANQAYVDTEDKGVYPYGSLGVDMLAPMRNLKFNANYNFQLLNSDSNASAFTLGVNYQFK